MEHVARAEERRVGLMTSRCLSIRYEWDIICMLVFHQVIHSLKIRVRTAYTFYSFHPNLRLLIDVYICRFQTIQSNKFISKNQKKKTKNKKKVEYKPASSVGHWRWGRRSHLLPTSIITMFVSAWSRNSVSHLERIIIIIFDEKNVSCVTLNNKRWRTDQRFQTSAS